VPAKCAPPLRPEAARQRLWQAVRGGGVDTIGSDHSPAPPEMKAAADFFAVWGGISGIQHGFPLLISEAISGPEDERSLALFAALLAANVAQRFRLPDKGRIAVGGDADLALLDLDSEHTLSNAELLYRHRQGPYDGRSCDVRVVRTLVRGRTVAADGQLTDGARRGHFLAPRTAPRP
jgi:allantoinase